MMGMAEDGACFGDHIMKTIGVVLTIVVIAGIVTWVRQGDTFHIARALPFCSGRPPGIYDVAGLVLIVLVARGLCRLYGRDEG